MKRIYMITICLVLCAIMSLQVLAASSDSVNLSEDEIEILQRTKTETVVKLYNGAFMGGFAEKMSIEDLLSENYVSQEIYMHISFLPMASPSYSTVSDGKVQRLINQNLHEGDFFKKYYNEGEKVLRSINVNAEVKNVYCLDGAASHDGVYIYYVTDEGDFVLYKDFINTSGKTYIIPLEKFHEIAYAVQTERVKYKDLDGWIGAEKLVDLDQYEVVASNNLYVVGIVILGSMLILVVVLGITVRRKKRYLKKNIE